MERGVGREGSGVCGTVRVRARPAQVGRLHLPICRTKSLLRKRLVPFIHKRKLFKTKSVIRTLLPNRNYIFPNEKREYLSKQGILPTSISWATETFSS